MFLKREGNVAYKISKHNQNLILRNFLPIENETLFTDYASYLNKMFENNEIEDVTSQRAEKNGTIILELQNGRRYGIYSNKTGYVRLIERGFKKDVYTILNMQIHVENNCFSERIYEVKSIDKQLSIVVKHIIFNKD